MKERDLRALVMNWLRARDGVWAVKYHGGPFSEAGVPDILACVNGQFLAIELKISGEPTAIQLVQINRIRNADGVAMIAHSLVEVQVAVFALETEGARAAQLRAEGRIT